MNRSVPGGSVKFLFPKTKIPQFNNVPLASEEQWGSWTWQLQNSFESQADYARVFDLSTDEKAGFNLGMKLFKVRTTPYYASLCNPTEHDPIRRILMPNSKEIAIPKQALHDPLGENNNRPVSRIVHRYADRVLFLLTDMCSVYCRYCTRKHFTATDASFATQDEYQQALDYIKKHRGIREVILSGGDPLTLSDQKLDQVLSDLRSINHLEIIRIGSRMPVVCPMRITEKLLSVIKKYHPVYLMTHFNHPRELTTESSEALLRIADSGTPIFNQMVLLNGVNNHPAVVQALSRRLLYLRTKPYYMFQCDPSEGTDYLRTSVDESLAIQKALWGHLSGLAMPQLSLDIPDGGGKVGLVPNFETGNQSGIRNFRGFDGIESAYVNPDSSQHRLPFDFENYLDEWQALLDSKN